MDTVEERPGGAANVAMNIAALGAASRLIGLTGEDDAARVLSNTLKDVNVHCDFVAVKSHPTITKPTGTGASGEIRLVGPYQ